MRFGRLGVYGCFAEGTVSEVAPMAIRYLIDHWEAIAESWKS